jgi:hypothetical protein
VQFAIGKEGVSGAAVEFPPDCPTFPVEVWVHQSVLGERAKKLAEMVELLAGNATPVAANPQTLKLLDWQPDKVEGLEIRLYHGWVVVSLDPISTQRAAASGPVANYLSP